MRKISEATAKYHLPLTPNPNLSYDANPRRREQGKERPLLVRFTRVEKKYEVMGKLKELKTASERYRLTSIAHDLTPRQREE